MHQEFCDHCIVIMNDMNDGGWDRWGVVDLYQGEGDRGVYYLIVFF